MRFMKIENCWIPKEDIGLGNAKEEKEEMEPGARSSTPNEERRNEEPCPHWRSFLELRG
ncbi:unnamed protein product, partial [Sphenostylis stenocarpa]